jgi:glutamate synthase domain-containing protein 3
MAETTAEAEVFDLDQASVRQLNQALHDLRPGDNRARFLVRNPRGKHAIAAGLTVPVEVEIAGHVGFYCAGMNQQATVNVDGHAGPGVGENMMSGTVRVRGNASQSAGATAHGGLLVIEGDASSRCGISMKGVDIVVGGSVGHLAAFMGQKGRLVVCGDAGGSLGDSLYEARLYVRGRVESLGADCVEKEMRAEHQDELRQLLAAAGIDADPGDFRRYGSARKLYNFEIDNADAL